MLEKLKNKHGYLVEGITLMKELPKYYFPAGKPFICREDITVKKGSKSRFDKIWYKEHWDMGWLNLIMALPKDSSKKLFIGNNVKYLDGAVYPENPRIRIIQAYQPLQNDKVMIIDGLKIGKNMMSIDTKLYMSEKVDYRNYFDTPAGLNSFDGNIDENHQALDLYRRFFMKKVDENSENEIGVDKTLIMKGNITPTIDYVDALFRIYTYPKGRFVLPVTTVRYKKRYSPLIKKQSKK